MSIDFNALKAPLPPDAIEWRVGQAGKGKNGLWAKVLAYMTSRAAQDRLDDVVGPANWQVEFRMVGGALSCGIGIRVDDEWLWKWDGSGHLAANDGLSESDAAKGDFSNAMKRAAVQWGIGRYLYNLSEGWAHIHDDGEHFGKLKDGTRFHWDPPSLPEWAMPGGNGKPGPGEGTKVDRRTGEVQEDAPPQSQPASSRNGGTAPVLSCPECGGEMWDNRADKEGGKRSAKFPDLKCKDKECDTALWIKSFAEDLTLKIIEAHEAGLIDAQERMLAVDKVAEKNPVTMLRILERLTDLEQHAQPEPATP